MKFKSFGWNLELAFCIQFCQSTIPTLFKYTSWKLSSFQTSSCALDLWVLLRPLRFFTSRTWVISRSFFFFSLLSFFHCFRLFPLHSLRLSQTLFCSRDEIVPVSVLFLDVSVITIVTVLFSAFMSYFDNLFLHRILLCRDLTLELFNFTSNWAFCISGYALSL